MLETYRPRKEKITSCLSLQSDGPFRPHHFVLRWLSQTNSPSAAAHDPFFPYKRASDGSPDEGRACGTYSRDAALSGQKVHRALFGEEFVSQWSSRAKASPDSTQAGRRKPGHCEELTGVIKERNGPPWFVSSIAQQPVCRGSCICRSDMTNSPRQHTYKKHSNWFNCMIESPDLSCGEPATPATK